MAASSGQTTFGVIFLGTLVALALRPIVSRVMGTRAA